MNFSSNNRFNSFYEDEEEEAGGNLFKTIKSKKKEKQVDDERFKFKPYFKEQNNNKPDQEEFSLETNAFPELSTAAKTTTTAMMTTNEKSFLDTLNKKEDIKVELPYDIKSQWVTITRDKKTGRMTYKEQEPSEKGTEQQELKKETKLLIKSLTNLHIKRTKDYINAWGIEDHYNTFYATSFS